MSRPHVKRAVLLAIAAHDRKWSWYQLDRALSGSTPDCIGPFRDEVKELAAEGLIEIHPVPESPGSVRYWMTEAGKAAAMWTAEGEDTARAV